MKIIYLTIVLVLATCFTAKAQKGYKNVLRETNMAFYKTEQAKQVGNQILAYQRVTGGWPKNIDMVKPMPHKIATAKFCLKLIPSGSFAIPSLTER